MIGSDQVAISALQISGRGVRPSKARPLASAKARSALMAFSPSLPSISPGENPARSRSTCIFTIAGSILSLGGALPFHSALLTDAASSPARAGPTRQTSRTTPASQRFKAISEILSDKDLDGSGFLHLSPPAAGLSGEREPAGPSRTCFSAYRENSRRGGQRRPQPVTP